MVVVHQIVGQSDDIACKFDDRALHAQTDPEEGNAFRACVLDSFDFTIDTPRAKARSNDDAIEAGQLFCCAVGCNGFAVNPIHLHIDFLVGTRMDQRFRDGFVTIF